jgi:hypothetical protein
MFMARFGMKDHTQAASIPASARGIAYDAQERCAVACCKGGEAMRFRDYHSNLCCSDPFEIRQALLERIPVLPEIGGKLESGGPLPQEAAPGRAALPTNGAPRSSCRTSGGKHPRVHVVKRAEVDRGPL